MNRSIESFNLVDEQWIPVIAHEGNKRYISLKEIFLKGREFSDLVVLPHERVSLMRFLICVTQASLNGPRDYEKWEEAPSNISHAVEEYLDEWYESFDLFHKEKPFLQISELKAVNKNTTPVSKLALNLANGENSALFDHNAMNDSRVRSFESLPLNILSYQNFCLGGTESSAQWKEKKSDRSGSDGPCSGSSMLHTFIRCNNIFDSLYMNLCTKEDIKVRISWGKPVWELMPTSYEDTMSVKNATETYLGRLVPLTRCIKLLNTKRMVLGTGFKYTAFPSISQEPSATVIKKNDSERMLLGAKKEKAIWRQLSAIMVMKAEHENGPITLNNASEDENIDIHVAALIRTPGKQIKEDITESVFNIPANMRTENGYAVYNNEVKFSEVKARKLASAIETWRKEIDPDWLNRVKNSRDKSKLLEQLRSKATSHFWTSVEKKLPLLMRLIDSLGNAEKVEEARINWRKMIHRTAREAYELACGSKTPRQMRAFALGLKHLDYWKEEKQEEAK